MSRGVGILVREHDRFAALNFKCDIEGRVAVLDATFDQQDFRFISVYAPTNGSERIEFFNNFDGYLVTRRKLIVGGDFNCLLDLKQDKCGGNPNLGDTGSPQLRQLLTRFQLVDIWRKQHPHERQYTWHNKTNTIMCRLDKFYISASFVTDKNNVNAAIEPYPFSDHDTVRLEITTDQLFNVGPGVWKLNVSRIKDLKTRRVITDFWTRWRAKKSDFNNVGEWWDEGKANLKSILRRSAMNNRQKEKEVRASLLNQYHRLRQKSNLSEPEEREIVNIKCELEQMDLSRIQGTKIRSKSKWIEENEKPSQFFFQKEKRGRRKTCRALNTSTGLRVTDQEDIMQEQVRFYKDLYNRVPTDTAAQERLLNLIDRQLTEEERNSCEGPLSESECFAALRAMSPGKTPGTDGLPKEFYAAYWDLLKSDFVEMANSCLEIGQMPESLRQALIILLFKKNDPEELKNWRPIALLNTDYKIIAKALVHRLKPVMSSVIHPDQCCSVPGRSSEDNATLLRDVCDYLASHERMACAFISLDQEKAFDSVDWEFLDKILETVNFGPLFCAAIKCIYKDIRSGILSNGYVSEFFSVQRGVRQGCPLSPLLFVMVSEVFGQAIRKCDEIQGLKLPGRCELKITQYADDNTCIVTNTYGIFKVFDVFDEYGRACGARLNKDKSKGLWLGRWSSRTDSPCDLTWLTTNLKIVGLHFGNDNAKEKSWEEVSEKFISVLNKWKPRFLTLRGKTLILNSLAASTIWRVAKIYPPTRESVDSLRTQLWKFVWSGKPELVRRETCMSGYEKGGLKIVDIEIKSKALLVGRVFKFLKKTGEVLPWSVLMRYYVGRSLGVNDNLRPNCDVPTPFYRHLLGVLKEFSVDLQQPQSSKLLYIKAVLNKITPTRARSELQWQQEFKESLDWKRIWTGVSHSWNDPLVRDFDWRTTHRVLPVNSRLNRWNS